LHEFDGSAEYSRVPSVVGSGLLTQAAFRREHFMTIKTGLRAAALTMAAAGALLSTAPAQAGEGHWSIGKGVQCRVILGIVICSKNRP